jgi:hypothetical protein
MALLSNKKTQILLWLMFSWCPLASFEYAKSHYVGQGQKHIQIVQAN